MKQKQTRVFIDQYNHAHYAKTVSELRAMLGGRLSKMYTTDKHGNNYHIGYAIGNLWLHEYTPVRRGV